MAQNSSAAMVASNQQGGALALPRHGLQFTPEQEQMIRDTIMNGATPGECEVLMAAAKAMNLNPLRKQIHFVKRFDNQKQRDVWSYQVSIDGFRATAERTGQYDGQDAPEYEYAEGDTKRKVPTLARVRVYRKGIARAFVGEARFDEYVQTKSGGLPNAMWSKMPHTMLAKCAEALAIRKAFPEELGGAYAPEEMGQAENEVPLVANWDKETGEVFTPETKQPARHVAAVVDNSAELTALALDFEKRLAAATTVAEAKKIGAEIGKSKLDPERRASLRTVYNARMHHIENPPTSPVAPVSPTPAPESPAGDDITDAEFDEVPAQK